MAFDPYCTVSIVLGLKLLLIMLSEVIPLLSPLFLQRATAPCGKVPTLGCLSLRGGREQLV